jgi:hypothetical protein
MIGRNWVLRGLCLAFLVGVGDEHVAWAGGALPKKPLDYAEAQRFVLSLINRDRVKAGLRSIELDEAASRAGARHARDMAENGFTGHVGSDGSVPEQRYTESGGAHFVQENAACVFDAKTRKLESAPRFDAAKLAELHAMFMAEVPPNDGHRRNILKPLHNRVGIGVAQAVGTQQPCLTQEFVDEYGDYEPVPRQAKRGTGVHVAGTVSAPLVFGGVGIGRTDLPRPKRSEELNGARSYAIPAPATMYFTAAFKTPKPVKLEGKRFSIDVELGKDPGLYSISVWAKEHATSKLFMISMRTVTVR